MTATEGLAYSCNAVLAQIGMRIDPVRPDTFLELGYARYPRSGLGDERRPGPGPALRPNWLGVRASGTSSR